MKTCKQCGRTLDDACFRKTKSRSKGIYKNVSQGTKTICRDCESINVRAHRALKENDQATIELLRKHYIKLYGAGHPPVSAAAKRLLGITVEQTSKRENDLMSRLQKYDNEAFEHAYKVRTRSYSSVDEADEVHRRLSDRLRYADLYEEITNLLDEWYMDE